MNAVSKKYRILYFEGSQDPGGSTASLYNLVKGLDRDLYEPIVVLHPMNSMVISSFQNINVRMILFNKKKKNLQKPLTLLEYFKQKGWFSQYKEAFPATYKYFRSFLNMLSGAYRCFCYYKNVLPQLLSNVVKIKQMIIKNHIDLIHTNNNITANRAAIFAAKLAGIPCICHIRGFESHSFGLNLFLSKFIDSFIFNSKAVKDVYPYHAARLHKGRVVYNAIEFDSYNCIYDTDGVRSEFGLHQNNFLAAMVGRLKEWKGQKIFLQALGIASQELSNLRGLIIGEEDPDSPGYCQELKSAASSLGLADKVIFTGWRKDVPRLMAACDLIVHCSIKPEPFGLVIVEGMAIGKPVIAANAGGVPEIITDGIDGVLVPPGDAQAVANEILSIASNRTKAEAMGVRAREKVKKKFIINRYVSEIENIYKDVLKLKTLKIVKDS